MMEKLTTKRFPKALTKAGHGSSRTAFVIPSLDGTCQFVELEGTRKHDQAYLVYTGVDVSVDNIMAKLAIAAGDDSRVREFLASFIRALHAFRIGNIITIKHSDGRTVELEKVAERPKTPAGPKLPG